MAINLHWCGGKLFSFEINSYERSLCECGKKSLKPKCCKDASIEIKASEELAKTTFKCIFKHIIAKVITLLNFHELVFSHALLSECSNEYFIPPLLSSGNPLYLIERSFRI